VRTTFAKHLHARMAANPAIVLITADLGFGLFDNIRLTLPRQFFNVGAAEQAAVGAAVGFALAGKIPVVYSITPFLLYRPFEFIRNYLNHDGIPVKLVGSGRDRDYMVDGPTHWALEDRQVMNLFTNITASWPETDEQVIHFTDQMLTTPKPCYLNLKR
jgi:transketolase